MTAEKAIFVDLIGKWSNEVNSNQRILRIMKKSQMLDNALVATTTPNLKAYSQ